MKLIKKKQAPTKSEGLLLTLIKGSACALRVRVESIKTAPSPNDGYMKAVDDGKIIGLSYALGAIQACLSTYEEFLERETAKERPLEVTPKAADAPTADR